MPCPYSRTPNGRARAGLIYQPAGPGGTEWPRYSRRRPGKWRHEAQAARTAYTYILPAAVIMAIITFFPLIFQLWMSATDYSNLNLRTPNLFGQILGSINPAYGRGVQLAETPGPGQLRQRRAQHPGADPLRALTFGASSSSTWSGPSPRWRSTCPSAWRWPCCSTPTACGSRSFYRAMYIIPWALPSLVAAMVWRNMFDDQSGSVNQLLAALRPGGEHPLAAADRPAADLDPALRATARGRQPLARCCSS